MAQPCNLHLSTITRYYNKLDLFFPELRLSMDSILKFADTKQTGKYPYNISLCDKRIEINQKNNDGLPKRVPYNGVPNTMLRGVSKGCVGSESKTKKYVIESLDKIVHSLIIEFRNNEPFKKYVINYYNTNTQANYDKLKYGCVLRYLNFNENIFNTIHRMYTNAYLQNMSAKDAHEYYYYEQRPCLPLSYKRFWNYFVTYYKEL